MRSARTCEREDEIETTLEPRSKSGEIPPKH
jgi:hypothetical protein